MVLTRAWDGTDFQALLASPSVRGTAWMLIQRPDLFGYKRVKSMTIWRYDGGTVPELLVEVEDVS